ncbi:zinc finger protein GLIS2 [Astyanax mexicanus]|uniref:zinc finger protein GLIS2 n=1 Tax=Astyanax mexicanus TaxID=7994 RepID=UPI0020CB1CBF|nr:zinc finger protein GLIS2 [Astyanax mexicanus]
MRLFSPLRSFLFFSSHWKRVGVSAEGSSGFGSGRRTHRGGAPRSRSVQPDEPSPSSSSPEELGWPRDAAMLSLDEPLDLKISPNRDRTLRTSICAPLRFARTHVLRPTHNCDSDVLDSHPASKLDLSQLSSSPPSSPSPPHSGSSCSPLPPPLTRDSPFSYQEGGASPPPGFQFFLPIGAGAGLRLPSSMVIGQCRERRDSPEPVDEQLACRWLKCHLLFECLQDLVDHVTEFHVKPERSTGYCCHWEGCARKGRGFNARYKMLIHIRTHTNEKPHQCAICSKSFSRLENLKIHTRSHTGEKPYVCPYEGCGKRYSNSSDRFKHTRTHYEDKPYCCKMVGCHKRYTDPSSLRKHIKAHGHSVAQESRSMEAGPGRGRLGAALSHSSFPTPGRAPLVLSETALSLLGTQALHTFTGPLMALDLSMSSRLPGAGALLCHSGPLLDPLLLPSHRSHGGMKEDDDDEDEGERKMKAGRDTLSWVFVPPGMVMLKQAVVS